MTLQTFLGFDFGMKRIGVAVGQTLTLNANPLVILPAIDGVPEWSTLDLVMAEWRPQGLVVGVPLNMDGSLQTLSYAARGFIKRLKQRYELPVAEADERLTTVAARAELFDEGGWKKLKKMQKSADARAAQLILEAWMREALTSQESL